jgi:RNA-directed DNA polymerase
VKRHGGLFRQIFRPENLYSGYMAARKGKRSRRACFEFEKQLGVNLQQLHQEVHDGVYRPKPYFKFTVHEPKERTIYAPAFRDCVVQHAIYRVIMPIFDRTFIDQSYACRIGKGTHKAADHTQRYLRECGPDEYVLKLDVRKFFYRINRDRLRLLLSRKLKEQRLIDLMMQFAEHEALTGIPIGNLLSQLYALIYLSPLDHYIKRDLKVQRYVRYVDDMVLIGLSKQQCIEYREDIRLFLDENLMSEYSHTTISKVKKGVNFVGYRTWQSKRFIRKHSLYRFNRCIRDSKIESAISILGHAKNTQSLQHLLTTAKENQHAYHQIPKSYRKQHHLPPA